MRLYGAGISANQPVCSSKFLTAAVTNGAAYWQNPAEIKEHYQSASILKNGRVVFNIAGNKYRLVVAVLFDSQIVLIKFVGTHETCNKINAQTIDFTKRS